MRIKINLWCRPNTLIPIEYNYNIYLNIRKLLFDFLKDHKPKLLSRYKNTLPDFTFSQLLIPDRVIEHGFIEITGTYLSFFISSLDNEFMEYLTKAINSAGQVPVHQKKLNLKKVEIIEEPEFAEKMKFRMLSPLLLMKLEDNDVHFLKPGDNDLNDVFAYQMAERHNKLFKTRFTSKNIRLTLDQEYLEQRKRVTRLLTIRGINYRTIMAPLYLEGKEELIRFAYHSGIGSKTQYGLGMLDVSGT